MKTIKDLAEALCQHEGLKKQVNIAQMSEILGVMSDMFWELETSGHHPMDIIYSNGEKRAKKRKAKRGKKK